MGTRTFFNAEDDEILEIQAQLEHLRGLYPTSFTENCPNLSCERVAELLEATYWSSLLQNEGSDTQVRVEVLTPHEALTVRRFAKAVPFEEHAIARLGGAVSAAGCLLVDPEEMTIWGIATQTPQRPASLTLTVLRPGVVRVGLGSITAYMVFSGREQIALGASGQTALTVQIQRLSGKQLSGDASEVQARWREAVALAEIARGIQSIGRGGALLMVPDADDAWISSISPFAYRFVHRDRTIPASIRSVLHEGQAAFDAFSRLDQSTVSEEIKLALLRRISQQKWCDLGALSATARLANVDGAVVMTYSATLIGFGAKIAIGGPKPDVALLTPESSDQPVTLSDLSSVGGMRHQSAVRFVGQNPRCAAIVISEDGPMSLMQWNTDNECVLVIRNIDWWG